MAICGCGLPTHCCQPAVAGGVIYADLTSELNTHLTLLTWEVGLPPSSMEFSYHHHFYKLSHSWLLGICHHSCLLRLACLFTVLWGILLPPSSVLRAPCPLCYMSFLLLLIIQFLFLPWMGLVCAGSYADLAQGCLWEYRRPLSSPVICIFPSHLGTAVWRRCGSPPDFFV
jgi:hypothetical protein